MLDGLRREVSKAIIPSEGLKVDLALGVAGLARDRLKGDHPE